MRTLLLISLLLWGGPAWAQDCEAKDSFDMKATGTKTKVFSLRCNDGRELLSLTFSTGDKNEFECKQATARCFKTYEEQEQ